MCEDKINNNWLKNIALKVIDLRENGITFKKKSESGKGYDLIHIPKPENEKEFLSLCYHSESKFYYIISNEKLFLNSYWFCSVSDLKKKYCR